MVLQDLLTSMLTADLYLLMWLGGVLLHVALMVDILTRNRWSRTYVNIYEKHI